SCRGGARPSYFRAGAWSLEPGASEFTLAVHSGSVSMNGMGYSPTSGRARWVVAVVGLALVACATSNGDAEGDPAETPTTESPARNKEPDDKPEPPKFDATIDPPPSEEG